jgi:hypothetical protein
VADFWQDQTAWPRDTQERVFLGRAVNQLGRALFGEEWTGEEPGVKTFSYIKIVTDSRATNNFIARYLPQFGRREYRGSMAPPPTGYDDHRPEFEFSRDELQELDLFIKRHNAKVPPAKGRLKKVQDTIADSAVAERLGTSFFTFASGDFHTIPSNWWIAAQLEQRFATCSINPNDPFGAGGGAWIFVAHGGLEAIVNGVAPAANQRGARRAGPVTDEASEKVIFSGKGSVTRAIRWAWFELFPDDLPVGMSSTERNDAIREKIKSTGQRITPPNDRTIQKALKNYK